MVSPYLRVVPSSFMRAETPISSRTEATVRSSLAMLFGERTRGMCGGSELILKKNWQM